MKILVRGTNWIGDAVMSIPALRELRRIFPDDQITLHTRSWADGLFRDASFIDELVTYDKSKWKFRDVIDNSEFLRDDGYDLAILLPNSFESALVSFLSRVPRRIGYNKDLRGLLLTDPVAVPEWKERRHEVFYYLNLIAEVEKRVLGRETVLSATPDTSLEVADERKFEAADMLAAAGTDPFAKTVALGVGSTNSRAKRWAAERFAELADRIHSELKANVVLVGSKDEQDVAERVLAAAKTRPINTTGKTDLDQAVAMLAHVDLLVSNDMGLAHVASSVGTDTIVIFGPTNPDTTRPFAANALVIRRDDVECSPCMLRDCPIDHRCMLWITVEHVFDEVRHMLEQTADEPSDIDIELPVA